MANIVNMYRGGAPDVKCLFCRGDYAEFHPPFSTPMYPATPPYNSHADAAQGQGYLNLNFPLVPHLAETTAHFWMEKALRGVKTVGDIILTNWVPLRSIVTDIHWEVTLTDSSMAGVYLKPTAVRAVFNYETEDWDYVTNDDYVSAVSEVGQFPIGTPESGDSIYGVIHLADPKVTFGHNLPQIEDGKPVGGLDDYFGAVVLGYEVAAGDDDLIAKLPYAHFALYSSAKCLSFECPSQI